MFLCYLHQCSIFILPPALTLQFSTAVFIETNITEKLEGSTSNETCETNYINQGKFVGVFSFFVSLLYAKKLKKVYRLMKKEISHVGNEVRINTLEYQEWQNKSVK